MVVKRIQAPGDVEDVSAKPANPVAGLDDLERQAAAAEGAGQAAAEQQAASAEQREADTLAADLADTLAMMATVAGPGMWWLTSDEFEKLWGKNVQKAIAQNGAAIMRRHKLTMGGLMTEYGPYIGLAGALGPSAFATVQGYKRAKSRQLATQQSGQGGGDGAGA